MSDINDRTQYDRLTQDWRQIHNVIWGIPSIAISVISGVIIVAYNVHGWPRILVLGIGSIFLFAMTVEIVKKRLTMDAMSARMQRIQSQWESQSQLTFGPFPSKTNRLIIERDEVEKQKKLKDGAEGTTDLAYKLFKFSHARASLTNVLFAAAIVTSAMTYWEFVTYMTSLKYESWSYLIGFVTVITISLIVAMCLRKERRRYKEDKQEYEKEKEEKERKEKDLHYMAEKERKYDEQLEDA